LPEQPGSNRFRFLNNSRIHYENQKTSVIHYLDGASGQYIPKRFAVETKRECISGVEPKDLDYLALGPGGCLDERQELQDGESVRGEFYWDVWQDVLDNAVVTDEDGNEFTLHQDDSLFLIPSGWEFDESSNQFRPPDPASLLG
jgi:hypothetical protein